jgi:hypothetical protein
MLYPLRSSTCQESDGGEVRSYTSSLVAIQNKTAAMTTAAAIQPFLDDRRFV